MEEEESLLDPYVELAELTAAVRAYAEWQASTGAAGLPVDDPRVLLVEPAGGLPSVPAKAMASVPLSRSAIRTPAPTLGSSAAQTPPSPPDAARPAAAEAPRLAAVAPSPAPAAVRASPATALRAGSIMTTATADERRTRLALIAEEVRSCTHCVLHQTRTNTVVSRGDPFAALCFIGEGPGAEEDAQGEPFVGAAGKLLDRMVAAMGYRPDEVYICNIVKCRPPGNRKPDPAEMAACMPFLTQQLALVQPKVIVALGATAVQGLLGTTEGITRLRGKWKLYKGAIPIMPTFHPAYLLRNPAAKRDVWTDLQEVMKNLGRAPIGKA